MSMDCSAYHGFQRIQAKVPGYEIMVRIVSYQTTDGWLCHTDRDEPNNGRFGNVCGSGHSRSAAIARWESDAKRLMDS